MQLYRCTSKAEGMHLEQRDVVAWRFRLEAIWWNGCPGPASDGQYPLKSGERVSRTCVMLRSLSALVCCPYHREGPKTKFNPVSEGGR